MMLTLLMQQLWIIQIGKKRKKNTILDTRTTQMACHRVKRSTSRLELRLPKVRTNYKYLNLVVLLGAVLTVFAHDFFLILMLQSFNFSFRSYIQYVYTNTLKFVFCFVYFQMMDFDRALIQVHLLFEEATLKPCIKYI